MTIMYTIGIITLSIAFTLSFHNILLMFERKRKVWILPILVVAGILLVLCATQQPRLDRYYQVENPASYQDLFPDAYAEGFSNGISTTHEAGYEAGHEAGYKEGYKAAIKDAILVEVTDNGYIISFNGEDNIYVYNNK